MKEDIKRVVRKCQECQRKLLAQAKQPIVQQNKATYLMQVLGSDLFYLNWREYIIAVDQYSWFPLIGQFTQPPTTLSEVNHLELWFNLFGVPEQIICDNGP